MHFSKNQSPSTLSQESWMWDVPYVQAINNILWPVVISRPDAAFVVGILSQFIQNLGQAHWEGVKRVIAYLGTTKHLWLMFGGHGKTILKGFCDMDWAGQPHRHLISGYFFHMGARAITWSSKKTMHCHLVEYWSRVHHTDACCKGGNVFAHVCRRNDKLVMLKYDNQGAIALSKDNKFHTQTKHIDIQYHFIWEAVKNGRISIEYVPMDKNLANIFTKPLPKAKFHHFAELLGLKQIIWCVWICWWDLCSLRGSVEGFEYDSSHYLNQFILFFLLHLNVIAVFSCDLYLAVQIIHVSPSYMKLRHT